ncbi:hypothetical protein FY034_18260 (plasmid) [Trichlorobacter lovleyi]|nr:hypothetical protein FY034_18260 [Trichlorobacter lovleyi]
MTPLQFGQVTKVGLTELKLKRDIGFEWSDNLNLDEIKKFIDYSKTVPWAH